MGTFARGEESTEIVDQTALVKLVKTPRRLVSGLDALVSGVFVWSTKVLRASFRPVRPQLTGLRFPSVWKRARAHTENVWSALTKALGQTKTVWSALTKALVKLTKALVSVDQQETTADQAARGVVRLGQRL